MGMNNTEQNTPLEIQIKETIKGKSRRQIADMLYQDFSSAYKADFKTVVDDEFKEQFVFERIHVSALIYPKCLREHIAGMNKRTGLNAVLLTPELLEEFKNTEFWTPIERAVKLYPHDDFYIVVPNPKLN